MITLRSSAIQDARRSHWQHASWMPARLWGSRTSHCGGLRASSPNHPRCGVMQYLGRTGGARWDSSAFRTATSPVESTGLAQVKRKEGRLEAVAGAGRGPSGRRAPPVVGATAHDLPEHGSALVPGRGAPGGASVQQPQARGGGCRKCQRVDRHGRSGLRHSWAGSLDEPILTRRSRGLDAHPSQPDGDNRRPQAYVIRRGRGPRDGACSAPRTSRRPCRR
jgi:hypothetical protein